MEKGLVGIDVTPDEQGFEIFLPFERTLVGLLLSVQPVELDICRSVS
jgi:hypothetical protein